MADGVDLDTRIARLARIGRAPDFSPSAFRRALVSSAQGTSQTDLLRRLISEWTGVTVGEDVGEVWEKVERLHGVLRSSLGAPVSLQTALLHEFHSRRRMMREPRMVSERDLTALRVNAITDPLTGLYNRRFFMDHLGREMARAERLGSVVSVLLMDLRGFKQINDRLGHPVGDGVLRRTARLIRDSLRVVDAGCRYGGDEFVVVLPNTDLVNSLTVAERIRQRVGKIKLPNRVGLQMGLHYGVATYPSDGRTLDFLMKMSDVRLYGSKQQASAYGEGPRRYPRFTVPGLSLKLNGGRTRPMAAEVTDIGYGGLAFTHLGKGVPDKLQGTIAQQFSSEAHRVAMKPVSVVPLRGGRTRVGCAFVT
ncbi:MAG TPA: GGDEF domain-containing protein [Vicinamibacteria bacterium]